MKSVLISIQPKWCELIANGTKTIEVRKTFPKVDAPFKVYIYCTANKQGVNDLLEIHGTDGKIRKANGKVIGEFVCDEIYILFEAMAGIVVADQNWCAQDPSWFRNASCLTDAEICNYLNEKTGYAWHISDLVIYDEPKELSEFKKINRECWYADLGLAKRDCHECKNKGCFVTKPPQSWCYVERSDNNAE